MLFAKTLFVAILGFGAMAFAAPVDSTTDAELAQAIANDAYVYTTLG
jgi:hypothetical protein